jgi:hypothetical protein
MTSIQTVRVRTRLLTLIPKFKKVSLPNFVNIYQSVQQLLVGDTQTYTQDRQTGRQSGDLKSLLSFFEYRLKTGCQYNDNILLQYWSRANYWNVVLVNVPQQCTLKIALLLTPYSTEAYRECVYFKHRHWMEAVSFKPSCLYRLWKSYRYCSSGK